MTELLTRDEYTAIAADMDFPATPFIDGKFRRGSGPTMPTLNPATGEKLTQVSTAGPEDVELAVDRAQTAFEQGHWARARPSDRLRHDRTGAARRSCARSDGGAG